MRDRPRQAEVLHFACMLAVLQLGLQCTCGLPQDAPDASFQVVADPIPQVVLEAQGWGSFREHWQL